MSLLTHPHPIPPLEGEGNFLSLRERIKVRVGIFKHLCEHMGHDGSFGRIPGLTYLELFI